MKEKSIPMNRIALAMIIRVMNRAPDLSDEERGILDTLKKLLSMW